MKQSGKEDAIADLCERLAQCFAKKIVGRIMQIIAEEMGDEIEVEQNSPIPEPAEGTDPDHTATGGVLIPMMAVEQSGELEAGEIAAASASASRSPALLAPGEPASVEGACGHAPPEFQSQAKEPEASAGSEVATSGLPVTGSSRHVAGRTATTTSENLDVTGGESAANIETMAASRSMDRADVVARRHGGTFGADTDARATSPARASSFNNEDGLDIPKFLRRYAS